MQSYAIDSRHLVQNNAKMKNYYFWQHQYSAYEIKVNKIQTNGIMFQSAATKKEFRQDKINISLNLDSCSFILMFQNL